MELRLAEKSDLPSLKIMFDDIVKNMHKNGITIWNEYYPYEEFECDIENKNLYLLTQNNHIVSAFGVYPSTNGQDHFKWQDATAKALYLGRVGVNVNFLRQGVGSIVLSSALAIVKEKKASFLRLLVVENNKPAINLYLKNGFIQAEGYYEEIIEPLGIKMVELGFEIKA